MSGLYAKKDFRIGGLHLNHRVLLQFSTVLRRLSPVPLASVYLSYFYEFNVVKGVLRLQIGLDGRYNTKYAGFGYNPAIGQFYNQREYDEDWEIIRRWRLSVYRPLSLREVETDADFGQDAAP
ncbi:MAG: putative porin [Alistipes indistinctus]